MSNPAASDENKVTKLLATAKKLSSAGKKQQGHQVLNEAASIDPNDGRVLQALEAMSLDEGNSRSIIDCCKDFTREINSEQFATTLIGVAKGGHYSKDEAETALWCLFVLENDNVTKNTAIGILLANTNGQKAIAASFREHATELFHHLWNCGDAVLNSFTATLLLPEVWETAVYRVRAVKDVFQLILAKLLEPAQDAAMMGMRVMARIVSADAKNLVGLLNASNFDIILNMLDIQRPATVRSQALMVTAKFLETAPDRGQQLLTQYVTSKATAPNTDDLVAAFSVAAAIFPILQNVAAAMFLTSGFLDSLISITKKVDSARLARAAFELLSAACVDKACREAIAEKCTVWLQVVMTQQGSEDIRGRAALVLCKVGAVKTTDGRSIDLDYVAAFLMESLRSKNESVTQTAVEGLVYASTTAKVKQDFCDNSENLECLVAAMQDFGLVYGGLTIVSHLVAFRPEESNEQQKMADLRAYANQSKPDEATTIDEDARVVERCGVVIRAGIVPVLRNATKNATPGLLKVIASISLALSRNRKDCGVLIQQGLCDVILRLSNIDTEDDLQLHAVRQQSYHALACILIPINPALILNTSAANRPLEAVVRPLNELITSSSPSPGLDSVSSDTTATFDALRAMTNIASSSDAARQFITLLSFDNIEAHLWSTISRIRQAATECILNLTESPTAAAKFFSVAADGAPLGPKAKTTAARNRLHILTALATMTTPGTARAATAALCNILAYPQGAASFMTLPAPSSSSESSANTEEMDNPQSTPHNPVQRLVSLIVDAVSHGDADMLERAITALCALTSGSGASGRKKIREAGGQDMLKTLARAEVVKQREMQKMVQTAIDELAIV